ncbi:MAG: restriction endonuclease subunit S [Pseudomonadota bacterium]
MKVTEIVAFNPTTPLEKGKEFPFIEMAALPISERDIPTFQYRVAGGSGSKFRNGDTLLARITPCLENGKGGQVRGLPGDGVGHGSTEFIVMRARERSDEQFVYYLSRLPEFRKFAIQQMTGTSGRQRVNWQSLTNFDVADLDGGLRESIGATLGVLDDKIELNRRMNETLEAMARAIFKDWFIDFGPTRAKAEGRAPYLAPDVWDLFAGTLDGERKPARWLVRPASDLFEFNRRESLRKGSEAPYLDMAALPTIGPVPDAHSIREYKSGSKFRDGDTLFARITPCLENGKTAYVFGLGDEVIGAGSTEFIVIRSRPPLPLPASYVLARDPGFRAHAERSMTGTSGRQRVSAEALSRYPIVAPSDSRLWKALGDLIDPMMGGIIANALESRTLARTRDLLLPKLLTGEIRLRDAEKAVEAVA